jgi:four helix bundle protein
MFDFQKLEVYQKARHIHKKVIQFLMKYKDVPPRLRDQLSRASLSVMLLIAEGAGRFTKADKKHFYIQARASVFETIACFEACFDLNFLSEIELKELNDEYENVSKMLFGLIEK